MSEIDASQPLYITGDGMKFGPPSKAGEYQNKFSCYQKPKKAEVVSVVKKPNEELGLCSKPQFSHDEKSGRLKVDWTPAPVKPKAKAKPVKKAHTGDVSPKAIAETIQKNRGNDSTLQDRKVEIKFRKKKKHKKRH